jgi:hypothetical protein
VKLDKPVLITTVFIILSIIISLLTTTTWLATTNAQESIKTNNTSLSKTPHGFDNNSGPVVGKFLTYQNSSYGIKILYPSDWTYKGSSNSITKIQDVVLFAPLKLANPDISNSSIGLQIKTQDSPVNNLSLIAENNINRLNNSLGDVHRLKESNPLINIAGNNSAYNMTFLTNGVKSMAIFTIKDNKLYYINYFAPQAQYSVYLPFIQRMIKSFELTRTGETFLTYENPDYGIKFQYPSSWIEEPKNITDHNTLIKFHSSPTLNNTHFFVWASVLPPNTPLAKLTADQIESYRQQFRDFNLLSSGSGYSGSGMPISRIKFTAKQGEDMTDTSYDIAITVKGDREVAVVYAVTDYQNVQRGTLSPVMQSIVDSLEIR